MAEVETTRTRAAVWVAAVAASLAVNAAALALLASWHVAAPSADPSRPAARPPVVTGIPEMAESQIAGELRGQSSDLPLKDTARLVAPRAPRPAAADPKRLPVELDLPAPEPRPYEIRLVRPTDLPAPSAEPLRPPSGFAAAAPAPTDEAP
jgi:hypothetical protein